jgi:tetratricopeptide (TPR) repeat protein
MKAHAAGKFDVALTELRAAYKLDPQPDLLYALGQVYSKLGRCTDANAEFEKFRTAKNKDAQISKIVDDAIAACHPTNSPFADTTAGEKAEPTTPEPAGEPAKVEATASEQPTPPPTEEPKPVPVAPPAPVADQPHPPPAGTSISGPRPWYRDVVGDALVAGGVVALVGAGIEYSSARSSLDNAENATSLTSYNSLVDDAHSKRTVSVLLGVGGAALIGAGVVRFMLHDRGGETHGVAVVPTSGGGLITWGGSL